MKISTLTVFAFSVLTSLSAYAGVTKSQRALVVISELEQNSYPELAPLYTALEAITVAVPRNVLSAQYAQTKILNNASATFSNLKTTLYGLAANPNIKAIDMIVNTHGLDEELYFYDGGWRMSEVQEELLSPDAPYTGTTVSALKKKLRMLYSTACFGASHNNQWNAIGFDVSAGALGVNANAQVEYGGVIGAWASGAAFQVGFAISNTDAALAVNDAPLRLAGQMAGNFLRETNSKKVLRGRSAVTINSDPQ